MSQKFISLEDAAARLGITKERLNHLRDANVINGYKDGTSWKFRTEHIERLESEGIPPEDEGEDFTLDAAEEYSLGDLGDDLPEVKLDDDAPDEAPPTEIGGSADDDDDIGLGVEPLGDGDDAESILLTGDDEIEGGIPRPQSTIIGKSDLSLEDDLMLASGSDAAAKAGPKPGSSAFEDLDELELDLETESRVFEAKHAEAARKASEEIAKAESSLKLGSDSDIDLDLGDASAVRGSDVLGKGDVDEAGSPGLSGPGSVSGLGGIDSIQLGEDEDDDLVLGGSDGSDGLATGDSGINLSPSDSGFALDEVPLDLGGSQIGSALDLAALSAAGSGASGMGSVMSGLGGEDFQLTPADSGDEEEDSSQIVALEEVGEEDEDLPGFEAIDEGEGDDDFGGGFDAGGFGTEAAAAPVAVGSSQEVPFPGWVLGMLIAGFFSMLLAGVMAMDLMQTMWSWDEPFAFSSGLMEGLLSIVGQ
ncbi:helix-turn-helix domain-containing protein [Botrimarina mediterranea]|uniref:Helix-turn-helix domain protein n=1 Tax=Botrimarina mediterranea TaxID=2528022 RepID=A0A518KC27_9BACT|nr:helix-turn-helix domain-containing protein [Botrimarina mediterranea]QDV75351.1 hypothetical protein Spa11_35670 [Botrimarina mediterranea]